MAESTESRYAQILKSKIRQGESFTSAASSAASERLREKADLRRMLPKSGILGAMAESMFGKAYQYKRTGATTKDTGAQTALDNKALNVIRVNTAITAKNSMVLPGMARDMNVMRQNIGKMTKSMTGSAATRADMFFLKSKERETAYEVQLAKDAEDNKPKDTGSEKKKDSGFFASIFGGLKSILGSVFGGILNNGIKGLIKGGLIAGIIGAIGTYFLNDDFRKSVNDMLNSFGSTIFGADFWDTIKNNILEASLVFAAARIAFSTAAGLLTKGITSLATEIGAVLLKFIKHPAVLVLMAVGGAAAAYNDYSKRKKINESIDTADIKNIRDRVWMEGNYEHQEEDPRETQALNAELIETLRKASEDESNTGYRRGVAKQLLNDILEGRITLPATPDEKLVVSNVERPSSINSEQLKIQSEIDRLKALNNPELYGNKISELNKQKRKAKEDSSDNTTESKKSTTPTKAKEKSTAPFAVSNKDMANMIYKKFTEAGFTSEQALAAVANAQAESGMNPFAKNITDKEESYGLFQMNRKGGLGTGHTPENLMNPDYNIDLAIEAAKKSKSFKESKTTNEAVAAFVTDVERPADKKRAIAERVAIANNNEAVAENTEATKTLTEQLKDKAQDTMEELTKALFEAMVGMSTASGSVNNITNNTISGPVASPYNDDIMPLMFKSLTEGR